MSREDKSAGAAAAAAPADKKGGEASSVAGSSSAALGGGGGGNEKEPAVLVLDIGTGSIKAGWAGEDAPRVVIPTFLLDHHGQALPASVLDAHSHLLERTEYTVGHAAIQALHLSATRLAGNAGVNNLNLLRPIERGEIKDYDTMSKIFDYIFKSELRVNPKDHPVMLTVSPLASPGSRAELAKMMFEVFCVPALCMANQAVLSLYSTGRTTGIVLEMGEGMTYAVPVYEGFCLGHAVLSIPVAGGDITKYLMRSLGERGFQFLDSQADTVRDIKEKLCRVKQNKNDYNQLPGAGAAAAAAAAAVAASASAAASGDVDETSYELPDGQMIRLDEHCRFNALEILFAPDKYAQALGVHLTGGANQSFGIPAQQGPNGVGSASAASVAASAAAMAAAQTGSAAASSAGGSSSANSNAPPGSAGVQSSGGTFSNMFGGGAGGGGGPIAQRNIMIDLSTNDLLGVHQLLFLSLGMVDSFLRRELLKNIVLAGGTSMARGVGERVKKELAALIDAQEEQQQAQQQQSQPSSAQALNPDGSAAASSAPVSSAASLSIVLDSQRALAAWIGASMYASLPTFGLIKITAEQYKRDENVVHKKYF